MREKRRNLEARRQDEELAAFADSLLAQRKGKTPGLAPEGVTDRPPLAGMVDLLARAMQPEPVPAALGSRVRQRVVAEWAAQQRSARQPPWRGWVFPLRRYGWAAGATLALLLVCALFLSSSGAEQAVGTASGGGGVVVVGIVLALVVGLGFVYWRRRR